MKVGILGAGNIASTVSKTLIRTPGIECYAVGSRDEEKAKAFAEAHGFEKAYGSYDALLSDPQVELVYIATPHSHHAQWMLAAMEQSKAVLSEKAFTVNALQAKQVMEYSRAHGVFAAEAIWPRYMPSRKVIQQIVESGVIGEIKALTANLCYPVIGNARMADPMLAGGALLDVGVYGINFALMHFGTEIERIETAAVMTDRGVDEMETITFFYKNGRMASITAGMTSRSDRKGIFYGEKGYIIVENINNPQSVSVFDTNDRLLQHVDTPSGITGYEYEFLECAKALEEGRTESWSMPLADSVKMMEIMDAVRAKWGF
ncbi:MAG: Gfo/Idh/MocA family oxidoreductase, partial [Oscillospiraceae bacterium]|nr:Gfo/Idh/MocA family oxidoreductase [Oscillospiraceae bacterium]